jgi:hypothetical protein
MITQLAPEGTGARTTRPAVPARHGWSAQRACDGRDGRPEAGPSGRHAEGWLRRAWHQIRAAVAEFHSDARQAIEVQMPWGVDDKWHTK